MEGCSSLCQPSESICPLARMCGVSAHRWCWTPEEGPCSSAGQPSLASRSGRSGPSPRKALAPAQGNADAPPDLAPLAPAQCLTSEQQARIEENRATALAKAQARRTASSLYETLEEDIGGEEDITVGEEDITVEGAVVPAPQSRGPISDREMAERDAAERPQCVICQDFFEKDEEATTLECGHVFHS